MMLLALVILAGCDMMGESNQDIRSYKALDSNAVIVIAQGNQKFFNYEDVQEYPMHMTFKIDVTYDLVRYASNPGGANVFEHNGMYYRWQTQTTNDTEQIGIRSEKITHKYSYLVITPDETLSVKLVTTLETRYEFETGYEKGWISKPFEYDVNLNGYFASLDDLETEAPEIFNHIDISGTAKYYIATQPKIVNASHNVYNSPFYLEIN